MSTTASSSTSTSTPSTASSTAPATSTSSSTRPRKLGMKALAVTDHGNMFGAVAFHDAGRDKGIKPILGCEIYVAPGQPLRQGGQRHRGGVQPHDAAGRGRGRLPQPREAGLHRLHRGLLPPAAHRQGGAGQAQPGPDRPLRLPLRRDRAAHLRNGQEAAALQSVGEFSRDLRQGALLPRGAWTTASRSSGGSTRACSASTTSTGLPLVATNDAHYLRQDDHQAHDVLLCIGSGKKVHDTERLRFDTERVLREERRRDGGASSPTIRRRCANTVRDRRDVRVQPQAGGLAARLRRAARLHHRELLREGDARRLRGAAAGCSSRWPRPGRLAPHRSPTTRRGSTRRSASSAASASPGYFLIVWDFIRYAREQGIPVGPGRGSAAGSLVAYCLRITDIDPIEHEPHLRALPERGAHQPARHRHRLLREPPRRGHRVRHPQVRPRERGPDHHLRDHEGQGGGARRRAACST